MEVLRRLLQEDSFEDALFRSVWIIDAHGFVWLHIENIFDREIVGRHNQAGMYGMSEGVKRDGLASPSQRLIFDMKGHGREFALFGVPPSVGILRDVISSGKVGLSLRVKPGHPSPCQRIRGRIAIKEVVIHESRAKLPRNPKGEDPYARKPHADMIVEVSGRGNFFHPLVEIRKVGFTSARGLIERAPRLRGLHT